MNKIKQQSTIVLLIISMFGAQSSYAWRLGDVFAGMSTNITSPGSYQDQAAGYYSGGGFTMRTNNKSYNPASMTPPSLKMGCSGIDMYMGSFSLIAGDQLVQMAKNLGTQAASYGFQLALKTFAPQIENLLSKLRDMAMELNEFSVEDCQAVQSAFASVLSKDSAMYESVCKDLACQGGGKDYFKARESCNNQDEARKKAKELQNKSNDELLTGDYNLFIVAAKKAGVLEELILPMMSIAGTIVMKDGKRSTYDSLVKDQTTWTANLKGGDASQYLCQDRDKCLQVNLVSSKAISVEQSYQGRAQKRIFTIKQSMLTNKPFKKEDKEFLSSIGDSFPLYDYLSLEVVSGVSIIDKATELVATYMIVQYLNGVIHEVRTAVQALEAKQINDQHFVDYLEKLDKTQIFISNKYQELMTVAFNLEKSARFLESHQIARAR